MAGFNNSLYPPVVDSYMPAFIISELGGNCIIYFSLSKYNTPTDIGSVWLTVNNQYTNESVLNTPTGLKAYSLLLDNTRQGDDKYYIVIKSDDIKGGWSLNQSYKVQLRFSYQGLSVPPADELTMNWIISNQGSFSEWSTVCLIKGIRPPEVILKNFAESMSGSETIFTSLNNTLVGTAYFEDEESLESYQLKLYKKNNFEEVLFDSGIVYTDSFNPNEINYFLNYALVNGEQYSMRFTYTTKSLYQNTLEYSFAVIDGGGEAINVDITATQDEEDGCISLNIKSNTDRFVGNLTIRRSSSETDFAIWEDVHTTPIFSEDFLDFTWKDYTVESGVWYKYCVQKRNRLGDRGLIVQIKDPVMVTLQDMFLTRADKQLKIKFNPQVNSFKQTVSDSMTQTLGSKYPFIKRNGNVNYRQFSISGLISHFCDESGIFLSENDLYKNRKDLYDEYNDKNRINEYNDFTLERTFREKVQEFLYANNVKLFRSPSEGNILVRLMDISLSPQTTLGRMLYTFSATAYEVDDINFENFEKYQIQKVGTYSNLIKRSYSKISQFNGTFKGNFYSYIQGIEDDATLEGLKRNIIQLDSLDIEIQNQPYLIDTKILEKITSSDKTDIDTALGYLVEINGKRIFIGPSGRYRITESDDAKIISVNFPYETEVVMSFKMFIEEAEDVDDVARQIYYTSRVGQIWGDFKPEKDVVSILKSKYKSKNNSWYQNLFAINSIKIEADPGSVIYLRDTSSDEYKRFLIGDSGYLNIEDPDFSIDSFYFCGDHLVQRYSENRTTRDDEWIDCRQEGVYEYLGDIARPVKNGVYRVKWPKENKDAKSFLTIINSNFNSVQDKYLSSLREWISSQKSLDGSQIFYNVIFHKDNWCIFSPNEDALNPVQGLVDYYYELERGEY